MSAWSGWVADVIAALGIPDTSDTKSFLTQWEGAESNSCTRNPLVTSFANKGSTPCKKLNNTYTARNYTSPYRSTEATAKQMGMGPSGIVTGSNFPHLYAALASGHPLAYKDMTYVVAELDRWGATAFATQVALETGKGPPGQIPPTPGNVSISWSRLVHALAHQGPQGVHRINHTISRARRIAR